jgi:hypothetical protein
MAAAAWQMILSVGSRQVEKTLLEALKRPPSVAAIPNELTTNKLIGKFQNWKESTSTSPFTKCHLGHYHYLLPLMGQEKPDEEPDESITQEKAIFQAHYYSILAHTVKHGRSIKRWQKVANSMIEKEPGNPKIHCLESYTCPRQITTCYCPSSGPKNLFIWQKTLEHSIKTVTAAAQKCLQLNQFSSKNSKYHSCISAGPIRLSSRTALPHGNRTCQLDCLTLWDVLSSLFRPWRNTCRNEILHFHRLGDIG